MWPSDVDIPGVPRWEQSAADWLVRLAPGYDHPGLRERPLLLAHAMWWALTGLADGTRRAYATAPEDLVGRADPADLERLQELYLGNAAAVEELLGEVTAVRDALLQRAHAAARGRPVEGSPQEREPWAQ